jgi:purine nucleosidase
MARTGSARPAARRPAAAPGIAADAIRALLRGRRAGLVTVIGLGPVTNLALAFATEPALADRVAEIVLMSGAWAEGNITPAAEFNAWNDPEALAILLGLGRPLAMATLDLTAQAFVTPALVERMAERAGGACWRAALSVLRALPPSMRMGMRGFPLHDPCAIAWAIAPGLSARSSPMRGGVRPGPLARAHRDRPWERLGAARPT